MKRILVLGGGYAGLTAAARLAGRARGYARVELIDRRGAHQALPILPDIIGRAFRPDGLRYALPRAAKRFGFTFRKETIRSLDPAACRVETDGGEDTADALLVATGTQTAFHGLDFAEHHGRALDTTRDGESIRDLVGENPERTVVVCGGSYTGVELATAVRRRDRRRGAERRRVLLVDIADTLCPALPPNVRAYVTDNVRAMGLDVRTGVSVEDAGERGLTLNDGEAIDGGILLWSAGVGAPECIRRLDLKQTKQGRLRVDPCLRVAERTLAAGDAAAFRKNGGDLRMSVQFAISQGRAAAENILRILRGEPARPFHPWDPGYLVPMANNRACGFVLGRAVYGRAAILLHYLMCAARSVGLRNRGMVTADAVRSLLDRD